MCSGGGCAEYQQSHVIVWHVLHSHLQNIYKASYFRFFRPQVMSAKYCKDQLQAVLFTTGLYRTLHS